MSIDWKLELMEWKRAMKSVAHSVAYPMLLISLYLFTKPLATLVDKLAEDDDIKFMED